MSRMKKWILLPVLFCSCTVFSQSVFGYWYGRGNVKNNPSANNYLVELILQPEKGYVKGVLNYYFKNSFRSLQVKGNYNAVSRKLSLYNVPVTYHGSPRNMEVDCMMSLQATLRVAKAGSNLEGAFVGLPEYRNTCPDILVDLALNADISKQDSVLKALREYKEAYQVWVPSSFDTLPSVNIFQRKVVNYVVESRYKERENVVMNEIEVNSDSVDVDFYDNGEIDGDSISVFFNSQLLAFSQKLSSRAVHFKLGLDTARQVNELSMYADNLGSIPPNTALMIVTDGKKQYEMRLSSNLEKNAMIRIRRSKSGGNAK
jgi:hypothetical protein